MDTIILFKIGKILTLIITVCSLIIFVLTLIRITQVKADMTLDEGKKTRYLYIMENNKKNCICLAVAAFIILVMLNFIIL